MSRTKKMRNWVIRVVATVWLATALGVFLATLIHPAAVINATLSVRETSFHTSGRRILGPVDASEVLVSGIHSLTISGPEVRINPADGIEFRGNALEFHGTHAASCAFTKVRSSGISLDGSSLITLVWSDLGSSQSFGLKSHGQLAGTLTSQAYSELPSSGFSCDQVAFKDGPMGDFDATFLPRGGNGLLFSTFQDARIDFRSSLANVIGDTQVPINGELRFSQVEPGSSPPEEKTVLLQPPLGRRNQITFEDVSETVALDGADLLSIIPERDFYLREFRVSEGIQLNFHGIVSDVKIGAGSSALRSRMPSLFNHIDNWKRTYASIPALAAMILAILERMNVLTPKK